MAPRIDAAPYLRFPKLDVSGALALAQILVRRTPERASPQVRRAAAAIEDAVLELKSKKKLQFAPLVVKPDARPRIRELAAAWRAIRGRLVAWDAAPQGGEERVRAREIHEVLFRDGLEFTQVPYVSQHAESEHRIELIDERGLADDLTVLVGEYFVALLRAAHRAAGDSLGITKTTAPVVHVLVTESLRALADVVGDYALQLLAFARDNPEMRDEVVIALAPIVEFREAVGRRSGRSGGEEDEVANTVPLAPVA